MPTLLAQISTSALLLVFGLVALLVARRLPIQEGIPRSAWYLSGTVFAAMAGSMAVQDIAAVRAFFSGVESPFYDGYLRWSPVANHGRTFFAFAFHLVLLVLSLRHSVPTKRFWLFVSAGLICFLLLGGVVGWREGTMLSRVHYSFTAVFDAAALFLLLGALFVALMRNAMDWVLWSSILLYSLVLGLGVIWHAALAWIRVPGAWAPSPLSLHVFRSVMIVCMVGLAIFRFHRLRNGIAVLGLFERAAVKD